MIGANILILNALQSEKNAVTNWVSTSYSAGRGRPP